MTACRRDTGKVRGGQVRRLRAFAFLLPAFLFALLPFFANAQIVHEETLTCDSNEAFVSSASVTGVGSGTDQLNIAAVAIHGDSFGIADHPMTGIVRSHTRSRTSWTGP